MFVNQNIPLADSNILISYFTQDKYSQYAKNAISKGCYYNEFILCEVLNFIQNKYSLNHSMVVHDLMCTKINQFVFLPSNYPLQLKAKDIRNKYQDNKFSFTDCMILAQAQESNLLVITDDDKMANYKPVRVINPSY